MRVLIRKMKLGVHHALVLPGARSNLPPALVKAGSKAIMLEEVRFLLGRVASELPGMRTTLPSP